MLWVTALCDSPRCFNFILWNWEKQELVVGLVVSEHESLVVVCLVRRNSISLNWHVWQTYVLRQLRRPRLWFQGETCSSLPFLLHMVCSSCISYMFMYLYNYLFIYFAAWRVDLKMMTFNSYWMIFRHIEVSNTKLNTIYLLRAFIGQNHFCNINLHLLLCKGSLCHKSFNIQVKLWLSLY